MHLRSAPLQLSCARVDVVLMVVVLDNGMEGFVARMLVGMHAGTGGSPLYL